MPQIQAPANVFVTGGSGFLGSWVICTLLDHHYHVRAAVRTSSQGGYLRKIFSDFDGRFEFVVIPDIQADGAFDEVLDNIQAVHHLASPVSGNPDEVVQVALNGTISVLKSVVKRGKDVRRVVITSSAAAVMEPKPTPCVYTEADWNLSAAKAIEHGDATPEQKYYASKTLAEQAAWKFVKDTNIDLVTILPTLVIGPMFHEVTSLEKLSYSARVFYDGILHEKPAGMRYGGWVDVRDVANAHLLAMEKAEASGQRYLISTGIAYWQHIYDALHDGTPTLQNIPRGQPGMQEESPPRTFNVEKIKSLGLKFLTLAESARDSVVTMRGYGW